MSRRKLRKKLRASDKFVICNPKIKWQQRCITCWRMKSQSSGSNDLVPSENPIFNADKKLYKYYV